MVFCNNYHLLMGIFVRYSAFGLWMSAKKPRLPMNGFHTMGFVQSFSTICYSPASNFTHLLILSSICTPPHFRLALETSWKVHTQNTIIIFVNLFRCRKRCNHDSITFIYLSDFGHTYFVKSLQHTDLPNWISTCLFVNDDTIWTGHKCLDSHSSSVPHTGT